jgi:hypothetical protein
MRRRLAKGQHTAFRLVRVCKPRLSRRRQKGERTASFQATCRAGVTTETVRLITSLPWESAASFLPPCRSQPLEATLFNTVERLETDRPQRAAWIADVTLSGHLGADRPHHTGVTFRR